MDFSIEVIPNYELEQLVLSYGEAITILAPPDFKEKMKLRVEQSLANAVVLQTIRLSL